MPIFISKPTQIKAAGNKPKIIREYVGRVNSKTDHISIAHMKSPGGWIEPGQTPEFSEYTVVLKGTLRVIGLFQFNDAEVANINTFSLLDKRPNIDYHNAFNEEKVNKTKSSVMNVKKGQAIIVTAGEWVQYSTPYTKGAEYVAICMPAFSPQTVHRDIR